MDGFDYPRSMFRRVLETDSELFAIKAETRRDDQEKEQTDWLTVSRETMEKVRDLISEDHRRRGL